LEEGKVERMKFDNPEPPITEQDIVQAEIILGINLPPVIRDFYLLTNGGSPDLTFSKIKTLIR
jgi:cell wall assembly regulator SMI1